MNVLLSIKPEYVKKITGGEKKYEFRKKIFKTSKINRVFIYSSSPEQKIIGSFRVGSIIRDNPQNLWEKFNSESGIDYNSYYSYFYGKEYGYAIEITDLIIFEKPINPKEIFTSFTAPQSYQYISQNYFDCSEIESKYTLSRYCKL